MGFSHFLHAVRRRDFLIRHPCSFNQVAVLSIAPHVVVVVKNKYKKLFQIVFNNEILLQVFRFSQDLQCQDIIFSHCCLDWQPVQVNYLFSQYINLLLHISREVLLDFLRKVARLHSRKRYSMYHQSCIS